MYFPQNHVRIAVDRLGGPTMAAAALRVSGTAIHNWIKLARIVSIEKAREVAKLSGLELQQLRSTQ
jgi:DNA-binding transcriptional regulator YdaS (Cro superfamily)